MATAFKCDRCGEVFDWYKSPSGEIGDGNTIRRVVTGANLEKYVSYGNEYELCPSCMAKLNDWLEPNKEKPDDGNKNEWNSMTTQPQCGVAVEIEFENGDLDLAYRRYGDKRWFQSSGEWVSSDVKIVAWRYID
jgi:hypothetical protein